MRQALNIKDFVTPSDIPGASVNISPRNYFPCRRLQLARFNGEVWEPFGELMMIEGLSDGPPPEFVFRCPHESLDMSSNSSSPPAHGSIRERAEALCELVREELTVSERLGRLTDKVVGELLEAGLFSVLLPELAGGLGGTRRDLFEAAGLSGRADGSTGWCISLANTVNFAAWRGLGDEGRADVFGQVPLACWTALIPNAVWTAAPGGNPVPRKLDLWFGQFVRPMGFGHFDVEGRRWP